MTGYEKMHNGVLYCSKDPQLTQQQLECMELMYDFKQRVHRNRKKGMNF